MSINQIDRLKPTIICNHFNFVEMLHFFFKVDGTTIVLNVKERDVQVKRYVPQNPLQLQTKVV